MTIVIVEDDSMEFGWLRGTLLREFAGAEIRWLRTESEFVDAIPQLSASPPALFILDMMLPWAAPSMNVAAPPLEARDPDARYRAGFRCEQLLAADPSLRSIAVIVHSVMLPSELQREFAGRRQGVLFLEKSDDPSRLLRMARSALNLAAAQAAKPNMNSKRRAGAPRVFISHSNLDKAVAREYRDTLELLGIDVWLDEKALHAGASLEREIHDGIASADAIVFLVTLNFRDEGFIATEIDYALIERRQRGQSVGLVTLVVSDEDERLSVPDLLKPFVYKTSRSGSIQGIREILQVLMSCVGVKPSWITMATREHLV